MAARRVYQGAVVTPFPAAQLGERDKRVHRGRFDGFGGLSFLPAHMPLKHHGSKVSGAGVASN